MIQDKIFFDEKDPTGVSYNTPFTVYGSYEGRLWSKTPSGTIKYYTQNSDLSVYATTGSNSFNGNQTVTGSLTVTGGITGSVTTASYVEYAGVANKPALVSSSAQIMGYNVFATTGSNQFDGSQAITGSLTVTGQVVAQTLNVQQVTSSIVYSSGSNIFGNTQSNTQQFTGSVSVTGSLTVTTTGTELQVTNTGVNLGNISTDNHNVTGSLRVSGSMAVNGNVGIGTTDPGARLTVTTPTTGVEAENIRLEMNTSAVPSSAGLNFRFGSVNGATIYGVGENGGNGASSMRFYTHNGTSSAERMRITSGGNVGIGTDSPTQALEVNGTGLFTGTSLANNTRSGVYIYDQSIISLAGGNSRPLSIQAETLTFFTGVSYTQRMLITSGGNVGIGTSSPLGPLEVRAANRLVSADGILQVNTTNSQAIDLGGSISLGGMWQNSGTTPTEWAQIAGRKENGTDSNYAGYLAFATRPMGSVNTERMRITSGGNVGIGTTVFPYNPRLAVNTIGENTFAIQTTDTNAGISGTIMYMGTGATTGNSTYGVIRVLGSGGTAPTNLILQPTGGNVGIGTTSPATTLHVAGGIRFSSSGADANRWSVYWNGGTGDLIVVNNLSDIRLKKDFDYNIKGLETIQKLKPLKFTWKDGTSHSTSVSGRLRQYGFIAQETMEADDYLAWHNQSQDTWGIEQYESFSAVIVKAIQELKSENDTLKSILQRNNIS